MAGQKQLAKAELSTIIVPIGHEASIDIIEKVNWIILQVILNGWCYFSLPYNNRSIFSNLAETIKGPLLLYIPQYWLDEILLPMLTYIVVNCLSVSSIDIKRLKL